MASAVTPGATMRFTNTAEIDFGKQPRLSMIAIHRWIRSLGVQENQVYGIMPLVQADAKIVRLKFNTESDYQVFYERYGGVQSMNLEEDLIQVTIRQAGVKDTFVRLLDVPFEANGDAIKSALQPFGSVLMIRREKYLSSDENDYFPVLSGSVTVRMTLNRHVPSYLRLCDQRILVKYPGQPSTCLICSQQGHFAANCSARRTGARFVGKWAEGTKQPTKSINPKAHDGQQNRANAGWPTPAEAAQKSLAADDKVQRKDEEKNEAQEEALPAPGVRENDQEVSDLVIQQVSDSENLEMPSQLVKIMPPPTGPAPEREQREVQMSTDSMDSDTETDNPVEKEDNHKGVKRGPPEGTKDRKKKQTARSSSKNAGKKL